MPTEKQKLQEVNDKITRSMCILSTVGSCLMILILNAWWLIGSPEMTAAEWFRAHWKEYVFFSVCALGCAFALDRLPKKRPEK